MPNQQAQTIAAEAEKRAVKQKEAKASEQHLIDSRQHFLGHLSKIKPELHAAEAKKYGWRLLNLEHSCGRVLKGHAVDVRTSVDDELRVLSCACGARGGWKIQEEAKK